MNQFSYLTAFIFLVLTFPVVATNEDVTGEAKPGGDMTTKRMSTRSYIFPGNNLNGREKLNFWTGFSLFRDPWVIAPSSTADRDGLGPLFNARSCVACHKGGSRGKMSPAGESIPTSLLFRLGPTSERYKNKKHAYGPQMQPRAIKFGEGKDINKLQAEAWLNLSYETVKGRYADGNDFELRKPQYQLTKLAYGDIPDGIGLSPRLTPNIFGAGLLDAIKTEDLTTQADPTDIDGDGISPRYNQVLNRENNKLETGRFGLKAIHPNLRQQVAAAFTGDIGITNTLFTNETCTESQIACIETAKLGGHKSVEIPDKLLNLVTIFNAYLGVPPRRQETEEVLLGKQKFHDVGCASCHTPSYTTDPHYPDKALANQNIWPYTNLALHDMGPDLADGVMEGQANGREWRTPPLWGIGLQEQINGEARYLHDGRARTLEEAILWHGGEASRSKTKFKQLSSQEREALIAFLRTI